MRRAGTWTHALWAMLWLSVSCAKSPTGGETSHAISAALPNGIFPVAGLDAGLPDADLLPVGRLTAGATLVGLGDPVHATGGVYVARFRLIKYLIETQGFRAFLFENPTRMAEPLTSYLAACARGTEEPSRDYVARSLYAVWNYRPVVEMFQWLCHYNASHRADPVRFYGFDIRGVWWDLIQLRDFLSRYGEPRARARQLANALERCEGVHWSYAGFLRDLRRRGTALPRDPAARTALYHDWVQDRTYEWEADVQERRTRTLSLAGYARCVTALDAVDGFLVARREALERRGATAKQVAWASIFSRGVRAWQGQMLYSNPALSELYPARSHEARDQGMAERVLAIHAAEFPNARALLWAANLHLAHNTQALRHDRESRYPIHQAVMMGTRLSRALGRQYAAIGFLAHRIVTRYDDTPEWSGEFTMRSDSLEARLNELGRDYLLVDTTSPFAPLHREIRMGWYQEIGRPSEQYRALFYLKESRRPEDP